MQYEIIILELLSRIKQLEEDVDMLKKTLNAYEQNNIKEVDDIDTPIATKKESSVVYQKTTEEMIEMCYYYGKKVNDGESAPDLADEISSETGMNRNTALMYLYAINGMLKGEVYKRAISSKALKIFFDCIFMEYGNDGLKKAIQATKLHIDYRRKCGHTVDSVEKICNDFERKV